MGTPVWTKAMALGAAFISALLVLVSTVYAPPAAASSTTLNADQSGQLIFLTSTGEILYFDANGQIAPALPYLPAINSTITAPTKKAVSTNPVPAVRSDHGSTLDTKNWYQIPGINYNALASSEDGSYYAMLRINNDTTKVGKVGRYQVYRLGQGESYWSKYGAEFSLDKTTVPPEVSGRAQAVPMGAVNPVDGKYYFASVVMDASKTAYLHIYHMDSTGPTYLGKALIDPIIFNGNTVDAASGDIAFTRDGSLVVTSAATVVNTFNYARMSIIRSSDLASATGGLLPSFSLPTITLPETGDYNTAAQKYDTIGATTGFAALSDGTIITSNLSDGSSYIHQVSPNGDSATRVGKIDSAVLTRRSTGSVSTSPSLCMASTDFNQVWNPLTANAGKPISGSSFTPAEATSQCVYSLYNTQVVDMAGSMAWVPSATLHKNIVNRQSATDQFTLSVFSASGALLHSSTTAGTDLGVQSAYAGPIPVTAGERLRFTETINREKGLNSYSPSFQCVDGNGAIVFSASKDDLSVTETTASIDVTVPQSTWLGVDLSCTFTNNVPQHSLSLTKVNAEDASALAGAAVRLWADTNGNGTIDAGTDTLITTGATPAAGTDGTVTTPDTGLVVWSELKDGRYLIEETAAPSGYIRAEAPLAVTISGTDVTATLKNEPIRATLTFEKRAKTSDAPGSGALLSGAKWTLSGPTAGDGQPGPVLEFADCVATDPAGCSDQTDTDPRAGVVTVTDLTVGTYTLQEVSAPSGYILDATPHEITLDSQEPYTLVGADAILNEQRTAPALPLTGGLGRDSFLIAGAGVLFGGLALLLIPLGRRYAHRLG